MAKTGPNAVFNSLVNDCENLAQDAHGVGRKPESSPPPVTSAKPSQDSHSALTDGPRQGLGLPMGPEWTSWKSLPLTVSCPRQVMLQDKNQMMSEMARFDDLICASQSSHVMTASTVGASRACGASVVIRSFGLF